MQRYALEQGQMREALAHEFSQFKERVAPLLLEKVEQRRSVEEREAYLTVLFLDMRGFARLEEEERKEHLDILRGLAQPLLQRRAAQYVNTWGDAIVACFEDANAGLKCACEIVTVLQAARIQSRIGMSRGKTLVRHNPLTGRPDIEGESVNLAARLEPLAELGGVLIDKDLRYHPEVTQDRFIFVRLQRSLKKAVGDQQKGKVIECYSVEFRGKSQR